MIKGIGIVLSDSKYLAGSALLTVALCLAYMFAIPVFTIPGNDFAFALTLITPIVLATDVLISAGTAVLVAMTIYLFKQIRTAKAAGATAGTSVFGGLIASVTCPACATTLLGFLGAGGTLFVASYRNYIALASFAVILVAMYFVSGKIANGCDSCKIPAASGTY